MELPSLWNAGSILVPGDACVLSKTVHTLPLVTNHQLPRIFRPIVIISIGSNQSQGDRSDWDFHYLPRSEADYSATLSIY